ncbi:MAG: GNAT family N-acetyltransferase [Clostridia bacterium]|nr:GNAT family N-acetyltransferase [Clostridia bacterium]
MKNPAYRVLADIPADHRLTEERHTDFRFSPARFISREEADARREELRFNLRMAAGLYPWPEKTPLNVRRETVGTFDGFRIEKIMFETQPGFRSTGNLYLPNPLPHKKCPAILNVIGHWQRQRLTREDRADYPTQLANFARMGFVCLVTDMIGMVDSRQISHGYGGGEKELWLSNGLGVQLWNNIRALDLLQSMPEVDAGKIGVTGASGGGSQSLFLTLLDDRIRAAAPINMISLLMQGGCPCENAPGLRRITDNCEMCSLIAPRPLFLAGSTGDWTREQETLEAPAIRDVYRLYGAEDSFETYYQVAEHQYNEKTRRRVYSFFSKHLMGKDTVWEERYAEICDVEDLTWFRDEGHAPGVEGDDEFFALDRERRKAAVQKLSVSEKRKMLAWMTGIGEKVRVADFNIDNSDGIRIEKSVAMSAHGEMIPFVRLIPEKWDGKHVCLVIGGEGKDILDREEFKKLLCENTALVSGDIFGTGEYGGAEISVEQRFFTTFHYTPDAYRASDVALLWQVTRNTGSVCSLRAYGVAAVASACALPLLEGAESVFLEKDALLSVHCNIPGIALLGGPEGCLSLADCKVETVCPALSINETTADDLENIRQLWADGEVMRFVGFPDGLHKNSEEMKSWYKWIESSRPLINHYSVFENGIYCGEAFYEIDENHGNSAALDIKLHTFARGRGIAAKALSFAIKEAFKHGAKRVWVDPNPDNKKAIALYEKLGFRAKAMPGYLCENGDVPSSVYMEICKEDK